MSLLIRWLHKGGESLTCMLAVGDSVATHTCFTGTECVRYAVGLAAVFTYYFSPSTSMVDGR